MRTRQRLIEVLDSVNENVVLFTEFMCCDWLAEVLRGNHHTEYWYNRSLAIVSTVNYHGSTHIRELLTEGLAILEADKLTGCSAS